MNDIHTLSGAYAVDAIDDLERARFERHLAECPDCAAEVASLREAATILTEATATAPPAALRERVLAEARTVRPLPPETPVTTQTATPTGTQTGAAAATRRPRRWRGLVAAAVTALVLGTGVGLGITQPWQDQGTTAPVASRVLDAPDAVKQTMALRGGGRATVWHSRSIGRAVVVTDGLPQAPSGRVYEMWLQHADGTMQPAGLLAEGGDQTFELTGNANRAIGVGITVEPAGGSPHPTTDALGLADLREST